MGFFNRIFGGGEEYPELDAESPAARRLGDLQQPLEELASQVTDPLEVVPADQRAYVFIGKPPKRFGLAWVEGGKVNNFRTLADEKGFTPSRLASLAEKLREAYEHSESHPRFTASMAGRRVVVTPSQELEREVRGIIGDAVQQ